jgi:hypothetical protein
MVEDSLTKVGIILLSFSKKFTANILCTYLVYLSRPVGPGRKKRRAPKYCNTSGSSEQDGNTVREFADLSLMVLTKIVLV